VIVPMYFIFIAFASVHSGASIELETTVWICLSSQILGSFSRWPALIRGNAESFGVRFESHSQHPKLE
jgi:hypothetical protein